MTAVVRSATESALGAELARVFSSRLRREVDRLRLIVLGVIVLEVVTDVKDCEEASEGAGDGVIRLRPLNEPWTTLLFSLLFPEGGRGVIGVAV